MSINYEKFTQDLKEACKIAQIAADAVEDGGSCNLDHVRLNTGKNSLVTRVTQKLRQAAEKAGCCIGTTRIRGSYDLHLNVKRLGQAGKD